MAVGGGSGGHVTPVVAVLRELKKDHPKVEIRFWCDFKFAEHAKSLIDDYDPTIKTSRIVAGKLRRYHHLTLFQQLVWPELVLLNIRDLFLVFVGFIQSLFLLILWRPDVVFTKGGYVCLPVGMAAKLLGIPLVIHDSDAHPGLTNRILARWAKYIATGAPLEYYNYPTSKARYVGIPISDKFKPFTSQQKLQAKSEWNIAGDKPLLVITGGGLGAQRLNDAIAESLHKMLDKFNIVLISGSYQYDELRSLMPPNSSHFQLHPFVSNGMAILMGAADIAVTRAGATTILELAALAKPTIIVPNGKLTGGHQLKNAKVYDDARAAVIVDENDLLDKPTLIFEKALELVDKSADTQAMANRFESFARPNAAKDVVEMITSAAHK